MKTNILSGVTKVAHRTGFMLKKHSPEILVTLGVVGTVVSTVLACKATLKLEEVMNENKETVKKIHEAKEHPENLPEEYTEDDAKKDLTVAYTRTALNVAKLYAPSVILGTLSLGMIFASNNILRKRNAALGAAYATLDSTFRKYRENVKNKFGTEVDKEMRYGIKAEKVTDENGNEKEVKTADINEPGDYARIFDELNPYYENDADTNLFFLRTQQAYANDVLKSKGYIFLNDVYDLLGFKRTKAGQVVGWVYDENNPIGDNYVDFGLYDLSDPDKRAFINGIEPSVIIDFNVDGNIWELMK